MASATMEWIVYRIIPIVAMIFLILWGFGALDTTRDSVLDINVSFGAEKVAGEKPVLPEDHDNAIEVLKDTIEFMLESDGACFAHYGTSSEGNSGLPKLDKDGTSISIKAGEDNVTTFRTSFGGRQVEKFEIEGMIPCVIAGSEEIVDNFEQSFLNSNQDWPGKIIDLNNYLPVDSISIFYDGENKIIYGSEAIDLEDGGYIYTPDNKHICFFPTVNGNNYCDGSNVKGLDDDCLTDDNEDKSIPNQIANNKIKLCGDQKTAEEEKKDFVGDLLNYNLPSGMLLGTHIATYTSAVTADRYFNPVLGEGEWGIEASNPRIEEKYFIHEEIITNFKEFQDYEDFDLFRLTVQDETNNEVILTFYTSTDKIETETILEETPVTQNNELSEESIAEEEAISET